MLHINSGLNSFHHAFTNDFCSLLPLISATICTKQFFLSISLQCVQRHTICFPIVADKSHVALAAVNLNRMKVLLFCLMSKSVIVIKSAHDMAKNISVM